MLQESNGLLPLFLMMRSICLGLTVPLPDRYDFGAFQTKRKSRF